MKGADTMELQGFKPEVFILRLLQLAAEDQGAASIEVEVQRKNDANDAEAEKKSA